MESRHRPEKGGGSSHETPTTRADLFVGRRLQVDELVAAMLEPGPVTVSIGGVSGVGKTALAREAARRLGEGGCEISWLDLSANVIPLGLEAALARSLGTETLSPTDLRLALRARQVVLVVDGADRCAADIVPTLQALAICPGLRIVVTSVRRLKGRGTKEVILQGLECPPSGYDQALAESWNGTSWSVATSSNVGTNYNNLYGVSCKEETCQSAGDFENTVANPVAYNTLAESWNGTSWSTETSPNASPYNNALLAASCATAANCMEVGHYVSQYVNSVGTYLTLAELWHGGTWTVSSTPNESNSTYQFLAAVACTATTSCQAVGYYQNSSGTYQTLIEKY